MKNWLLSGILLVSTNALAGSSFTGTINKIVCHTSGISPTCQVSLNGTPSNETCGTSSWKYTFDGTTPEGKNILSILLAAQVGKQSITLGGTGACVLSSGSEDLRHAYITTN